MTDLNYNIDRNKASFILWISSRTLDRYIKSGKLSYKKKANRVYLIEEEVNALKIELSSIEQEHIWELISSNWLLQPVWWWIDEEKINNMIRTNFESFAGILKDKEKLLEEKNQMIFILQKKIWDMELKLQTIWSLPDFSKNNVEIKKQNDMLNLQKERLEYDNSRLDDELRKLQIKNIVYIMVIVLIIMFLVVFFIIFGE